MKVARAVTTAILLAVVMGIGLALSADAQAHARVVATSPGEGQTVAGDVPKIWVKFDDVVTLVPHALAVTTDLGLPVSLESPHIVRGTTLEAFVQDHLAPGPYAVAWRIQADDGHIESASFTFSVAAPAAATGHAPLAAPPPGPAPGEPVWPVLVAAGIAVVGGAGAAVLVRRGLRIAAAGHVPATHVTQKPGE